MRLLLVNLTRVKRMNVIGQHDFIDGNVAAGQIRAGEPGRFRNENWHLGKVLLGHRFPGFLLLDVDILTEISFAGRNTIKLLP